MHRFQAGSVVFAVIKYLNKPGGMVTVFEVPQCLFQSSMSYAIGIAKEIAIGNYPEDRP